LLEAPGEAGELFVSLQALKALRPREAEIFAGLADSYCSPQPALPALAETSAVAFVDDLVARSGRVNRVGFRLILRIVELVPLIRGYRSRFTKLGASRRVQFVRGLDTSRWALVRILGRLLKTVAVMSYYGDERVLRSTGFDPGAIVARGRALRNEEQRP
jgi:hypothetical protein